MVDSLVEIHPLPEPTSWGADGDGMERGKRDMERQIAMGNRERIVIG